MSTPSASSTPPAPRLEIAALVSRWRRPLTLAIVLLLALAGGIALRRLLDEVKFADVRSAWDAIPGPRFAVALALTAVSYGALTCYDWLALRAIGRPLAWRTASVGSFVSYAFGHNLGLSLITGGSARLRIYGRAGLSVADVARVTLIASVTFWLGLAAVGGMVLVLSPAPGVPFARPVGVALLAGVGALAALSAGGVRRVGVGGFSVPLPGLGLFTAQVAAGMVDIACAAGALFVLADGGADPGRFFASYAAGVLAGLVSHVPGGVGVFETAILATLPGSRSTLFAALIAYRLIYYLLPLVLAAAAMLVLEARRLRRPFARTVSVFEQVAHVAAPSLTAMLVFGSGAVLLLSGALPPAHGRMQSLRELLPLPVVEASHFAASLAGTALLIVAPALQARLRSGFLIARALLLVGVAFSLAKGIDYEEASLLLGATALLQITRPVFYRTAGIAGAPLSEWWWAAVLAALLVSVWTGFFAYQHVPYSSDLWWAFAWRGNASRFLRATLGASVLLVGVALRRLTLAPSAQRPGQSLDPTVADRALALSPRSDAALAFTGDKSFIVASERDAFLMYRRHRRTWVVMGDPVGPEERWPELVWEIRRLSDAAHGRLCIYQASARMLPLIVDLGLRPMKYGEEAIVDLSHGFPLDGKARKSLRHSINRAEAEGLRFEVIAPGEVPRELPALEHVSDAWLADKDDAEKGFSVGRFDPAYLCRGPVAVLRRGGEIVAFANIWSTADKSELSVDLMRHLPHSPYGTMDLLFVRLMQWGAEQGYRRFNLGLAPLSGLAARPLAPFWSRAGAAIYEHGERFYGFSGLRSFKAKFNPEWVPRYVATPGGIAAARALIDIAALIGG